MRRLTCSTVVLALCVTVAQAQAPSPLDRNRTIPIQLTWDLKIPMRDGIKLSASLYRDPKQTRPLPVIVALTPYIATHLAKQGNYFAQRGYVFAAVDSRGRGNSDGVFVPGRVEARDGHDLVEWLAKQPWSDGQVAMWGGSWLGFTQWTTAKEFPPHLKAIAPTASVYPGIDYPQSNGIFMSYMLQWLSYVHGRVLNEGLFGERTLWTNARWAHLTAGRPFQELDEVTGVKGTVFREWLAHPREDAYWRAITPRPDHYAKIQIPVLTIAGHYDGDQKGALTYYERHVASAPREAAARHSLVLGPWNHAGTRRPVAELGGLSFGAGAVIDMEALHKAWYDHVLKGGPRPDFLKDRVACFIMGRNTWVYAPELKQIEGAPLRLELDAGGAVAGNVLHGGRLLAQTSPAASVTLISDPKFVPPLDELLSSGGDAFLKDQTAVYKDVAGQVVWHSAPFPAETVLAGRPRVRLQVSVDQPDADLWLSLSEVLADGSAVALSHSSIRLRYRGGTTEAVPMVPGKPERVDVPPMTFFARSIAKGSRLRLLVDAGPRFGSQRNTHTGGDLASEPLASARIARITITTGADTGSAIELPRLDEALLKLSEPAAPAR